MGTAEASPEKVTISGPASLIGKIDRVDAPVDASGIKQDTTVTSSLKVIDKNQDSISDTKMSYLKFDIGEPVVDVHVDLWSVRDEVKLNVNYMGEPAEGYQIGNVSITPSTISVAGTDEALANLAQNGYTIDLPAGAVVVDGQEKRL